ACSTTAATTSPPSAGTSDPTGEPSPPGATTTGRPPPSPRPDPHDKGPATRRGHGGAERSAAVLNNQIIITDGNVCVRAKRNDKGVVDAADLTTLEWEELRSRNADSTKVKLVKCARCWELYRSVQWMQTFNRMGTRVFRHRPGEQRPDQDYESVATAPPAAYNGRAFMIVGAEGYTPRKEAWAPNRTTRADGRRTGIRTSADERQRSPFSAG